LYGTYKLSFNADDYELVLNKDFSGTLGKNDGQEAKVLEWEYHSESEQIFLHLKGDAQSLMYSIRNSILEKYGIGRAISKKTYDSSYFGLSPQCHHQGRIKLYIKPDLDIYFLQIQKPGSD